MLRNLKRCSRNYFLSPETVIQKVKSGISSPKARVFALFLVFAIGAWLISRLSQTYTHTVSVQLTYQEPPDSLILVNSPAREIPVRLRANGFQLLSLQLIPKEVDLDLSRAHRRAQSYIIDPAMCSNQIQQALGDGIGVVSIPNDSLRLNFQALRSKSVEVRPNIQLELAQNFMVQGSLEIRPPRVHLLGPPDEIDTINQVFTVPLVLTDLREDFESEVAITGVEGLPNTRTSVKQVRISGNVIRFSEVIIEIPVMVTGVPEGMEIRTFPDNVSLLCKGGVSTLKDLKPSDFRVEAPYDRPDPESGRLPLLLVRKPESILGVDILESSVEFIIRKE